MYIVPRSLIALRPPISVWLLALSFWCPHGTLALQLLFCRPRYDGVRGDACTRFVLSG